ncbi:MAG: hypothetical protein JL50_19880 [Peptococcaceae bacterium BICA1-7]|nr:MAG: hypothetical protein JL50_19880 [Peptococcaceae bacterium BICA1-7]
MDKADIIVIGGGPGGYSAAIRGAQAGAAVVLVEKDTPGGTCLNRGCIPTKSLINSVSKIRSAQRGLASGIMEGALRPNLGRLMDEKNKTVDSLRQGLFTLLKKNRVSLINAAAGVSKPGEVRLLMPAGKKEYLSTKNIILATGSSSVLPPIEGINLPGVMDSEKILNLKTLPEKLLIIGGGVIGLEFAGIFSGLGSRVALVEMLPALAQSMDTDISRRLLPFLKKAGVEVFLKTGLQSIKSVNDKLAASLVRENKEVPAISDIDVILAAAGRAPSTQGIDIEALGLEMHGLAIKTNEKMETNIPGIYAVGDCTGGPMLAHAATAQGSAAAENALGGNKKVDLSVVPECIFTCPEMASVGLSEDRAKYLGRKVLVSRFPYAALGKAVAMGETCGLIKLIADRNTGVLLGGQILGYTAAELIAEVALAVRNSLKAEDVAETIHAHPTLAEGIMEAAHGIGGKPLYMV